MAYYIHHNFRVQIFSGFWTKCGNSRGLKGEVQSRITIISKERVKISLQIGAKMMKIG